MLKPGWCCFFLCIALFCVSSPEAYPSAHVVFGSQYVAPTDSTGIDLFEKGDDVNAIKTLRDVVKKDGANVRAWHYLGLALERQRRVGEARKAYERAAKLGDAWVEAVFLKMEKGDDTVVFRQIHERLIWAVASAQKYISLDTKPSKTKRQEWSDRLQSLRDFEELSDPKSFAPGQRQVFTGKEVTSKLRITNRPEPAYTEQARRNQVTGTVVLQAVFAMDGRVKAIRALKTLPDGLTDMAVYAARQIRFIPATKDGKPVSIYMHLEYNFNLY
ncbi:MAG: uncharacterized protein JWM21_3921 [Acidobacteria bacterium]|nr:uncharacterized protein [Acidobacteriota bacterium]